MQKTIGLVLLFLFFLIDLPAFAHPYFPLAVGNYRIRSNPTGAAFGGSPINEYKILGQTNYQGNTAYKEFYKNGSQYMKKYLYYEKGGSIFQIDYDHEGNLDSDSAIQVLPKTLKTGTSWTQHSGDNKTKYVIEDDNYSCTTEAGSFEKCLMVRAYSNNDLVNEIVYAPGVGEVSYISHLFGTYTEFKLVDYKAQGK